jgi:hypothetical protein
MRDASDDEPEAEIALPPSRRPRRDKEAERLAAVRREEQLRKMMEADGKKAVEKILIPSPKKTYTKHDILALARKRDKERKDMGEGERKKKIKQKALRRFSFFPTTSDRR